ncbi:MAG: hypothetical protein ACRYFX_10865 [Janthinobacterium lividum]
MVAPEDSQHTASTIQIAHADLQVVKSDVHWLNMQAASKEPGFEPGKQPVMCDFEVIKHEENPTRFFITLVLEMENSRRSERVLFFAISTVTEFEFRPESVPAAIPSEEAPRWHLFSIALNAAIGLARGYLANYLAPTIYRGYILPMLNLEQLMEKKYSRPLMPAVPSGAPSEKPPRKPHTRKPKP